MAEILNHNRLALKNPPLETVEVTSKSRFAAAALKHDQRVRSCCDQESVPPSGSEGGHHAWLENASESQR